MQPNPEAAVLGSLLIDQSKIKEVRNILDAEDFSDQRHEWIYRGLEFLDKKQQPIDVLTLSEALKNNGVLDHSGGLEYLAELTNYVPTAAHVIQYAKIVAEESGKRKVAQVAEEISKTSSDNTSLQEKLEKVKQQIEKVNSLNGKDNKYQVASMLDYVDAAKESYENWGKMQGLSTGFPSIDKLTLGLVGGELIVIAGPTSKGKTLLSMNIANNVAKNGGRVLFVTLEMTHAELTKRYMYANDGWNTDNFSTVAANTIFQVNDELNWQDVDGLMQNAKEELDVDLVIIDHLHYFTRDVDNMAEVLGRITKEFKKNAKRYNVPVILISHIRRLGQDEKLSGESLRGSSLIAQDSDIVLLVNRDAETNEMGIMIDKNRNRGKLSDRTPYTQWVGDERDVNTVYLEFNNTKLRDPTPPEKVPDPIQQIFPGAKELRVKE